MANKFVIVPKELYEGLITSNKSPTRADLTDLEPLQREAAALQSIQHSRKKARTKNTLYQQQLRRYLRLRKRTQQRPIKVRLESGAPVLLKPPAAEDVVQKPSEEQVPFKAAIPNEDGEWEGVPPPLTPKSQRNESFSTPKSIISSKSTPRSLGTKEHDVVETKRKRNKREDKLTSVIDVLYEHVRKDPANFGLSSEGTAILSTATKKPIASSNTRTSLEHIVRGSPGSPRGTTSLRYKLHNDPFFKEIMGTIQQGQGKGVKKLAAQTKTPFKFRPAKWTK